MSGAQIQLTLLLSSCSSSFMELEGEGVADLLAGGDGEVWAMLGPAMFRLTCPLSWDWLMVVNWFRDIIPLGPFIVIMDFITMAGLGGYWRRWPGPRFCNRNEANAKRCLLGKKGSNRAGKKPPHSINLHLLYLIWPSVEFQGNTLGYLHDTRSHGAPSWITCVSLPKMKSGSFSALFCGRWHVIKSHLRCHMHDKLSWHEWI